MNTTRLTRNSILSLACLVVPCLVVAWPYYLTAGAFIPIVTTASRFMQKPLTAASYP